MQSFGVHIKCVGRLCVLCIGFLAFSNRKSFTKLYCSYSALYSGLGEKFDVINFTALPHYLATCLKIYLNYILNECSFCYFSSDRSFDYLFKKWSLSCTQIPISDFTDDIIVVCREGNSVCDNHTSHEILLMIIKSAIACS